MRLLVVVAIVCAGGNAGAQSSPPSKTLERALKLYDRTDYYSASIELRKVVDGETGDAPDQVQRAQFFLGKTVYRMQFPSAALAMFDKVAQTGGTHQYYRASLKWAIDLLDLLPDVEHGIIGAYDTTHLNAPELQDKGRDGFRFHLGRHLLRSGNSAGLELLATIGQGSQYRSRAALLLAERRLAARDAQAGLAEAQIAARDPGVADDAVRVIMADANRSGGVSTAAAQQALAAIGKTNALAQLELSRLQVEVSGAALPGVDVVTFDTIAIAAACTGRPFAETVGTATARIEEMLERDDHAEAYEHIVKKRRDPVYGVLLADRGVREVFAWVASLDQELAHFRQADRAWQTTAVAAEILQELTVQQTVAAAEAGKLARSRIDRLAKDLPFLRAFGESGVAKRIVVPPELCTSILGMPARLAQPTPQPIPVTPPRANGCAGCSSRGTGGGLALVALIGLVSRRRRRHRRARA